MIVDPAIDMLYGQHLQAALDAIRRAMAAEQLDALLIHAGSNRMAFLDDQPYPFRVNPWFAWLTPGFIAPDSVMLIRHDSLPLLLAVSPEDFWHSPPAAPTAPWTQHFDVRTAPDANSALAALPTLSDHTAWVGEPPAPQPRWSYNPPRLLSRLEQARCRKTPYELACLRNATRIAVHGHHAAEQAFRAGASEFDIHMAFLAATRQNEAELPYGSIVALNEHGATLHYQLRATDPPPVHRSLLIDAGANACGYASDITRTWAAAPGVFASLVASMHRIQQDLCATAQPGTDWRELHLGAHHQVAALLREADVLRPPAEDTVALGISATFLPHGLGHLLGLQVHDVGGFHADANTSAIARPPGHPALRLTRRLEPGMVVTVEPGLYFIDSLLQRLRAGAHAQHVNWELIEALRPYGGIRIEDNIAITASGHENLTRMAFAAT
jgi:Xaa-Pro dipeptidase